MTLVEGGYSRQVWTTAGSVEEALRGLGMNATAIQMSASPATPIPLDGLSVELSIPRTVTVADGAAKPRQLTTKAGTVAALLAEQRIPLGPAT